MITFLESIMDGDSTSIIYALIVLLAFVLGLGGRALPGGKINGLGKTVVRVLDLLEDVADHHGVERKRGAEKEKKGE